MGQFTTRGIPEVPLGIEPQLRRFLTDLRQSLLDQRGSQVALAAPTNFKVTPEAFGNLLQWTPVAGADFHEVLWNTAPTLVNAVVAAGLVSGGEYFHFVGQSAVTRWYWIQARKFNDQRSSITPAVSGTTLASGTAVAPPTPPPVGQTIVQNQRTGDRQPLRQLR